MDTPSTAHVGYRFASLARELSDQSGSGPTARRIVDLAVTTIGCAGSAITTLRDNGTVRVISASESDVLIVAADIANRTGQSATKTVMQDKATVVNNDMEKAGPRDEYRREMLARTPIRSTASFYLMLGGVELGVMNFYSTETGFFTADVLFDCSVYADHAALAFKTARAEERNMQLATAVDTNREIGMAIGIAMSRYTLTKDAAFDMLVLASSHTNRKLHDIAAETIRTGDVPEWRTKKSKL